MFYCTQDLSTLLCPCVSFVLSCSKKSTKFPLLKQEVACNSVASVICPDNVKTLFKKEIMCYLALFSQITEREIT